MAYFLSPIGNDQQCDANGNPLVGGKIYTYLAGTTTAAATYTDSISGTQQANPIILNSMGLPASPIWMIGGQSVKFVIKDSADALIRTIDNVAGVNDTTNAASEWTETGLVPTYISTTQFSVVGDQTPTLQVNRRVRTRNTAGYIYSRITASAYSAGLTTVTVLSDSGTLDSGLSLVAVGFLSYSPTSLPYAIYAAAGANADITSLTALTAGGLPDNCVLTADIANAQVTPAKLSQPLTLGTAVATTSGTSHDFTGIPGWVNLVTLSIDGVSTNGGSSIIVQIGDSGGIETSGYVSGNAYGSTTTGFVLAVAPGAGYTQHGALVFTRLSGNTWVQSGCVLAANVAIQPVAGSKTLSATLDRIRLTTVNGTDTFDAGSVNILYE